MRKGMSMEKRKIRWFAAVILFFVAFLWDVPGWTEKYSLKEQQAGQWADGMLLVHGAQREKKKVIVSSVRVASEDGKKVYDDSRSVELVPEVFWEGGKPDDDRVSLEVCGYARNSDTGIWKVDVEYGLVGPDADDYRLECSREAMETRVEIVPKTLTVWIMDARKPYGSGAGADGLIFEEGKQPVTVTGFMKNGSATGEMPKGFSLPELMVDENVVQKDSPMFQDGVSLCYREAITLKEAGAVGKKANYCYAPEDTRYTRKGNITLTEGVPDMEKLRITAKRGSFFWDARRRTYRVTRGTVLQAEPMKGSGYNQTMESEVLDGSGIWRFCMEKRGKKGGLLAKSGELAIAFETDGKPPEGEVFLEGKKRLQYETSQSCQCSVEDVKDDFPGETQIAWYLSKEPMSEEKLKGQEEGWIASESIRIMEEGIWYPYVCLKDQAGNTAYRAAGKAVIDHTAPVFNLSGVSEGGSLTGEFRVCAAAKDRTAGIKKSSMKLYRILWQEKEDKVTEKRISLPAQAEENVLSFGSQDASGEKLADGRYVLKLSASDRTGNCTRQEIHFSVNQKGPLFFADEETKRYLAAGCFREGGDMVFLARDTGEITDCRVLCCRSGEVAVLKEGVDYQTECRKLADGMVEYRYRIRGETFQREGSYRLIFSARDDAGNQGDSETQKQNIAFTIDRTPPVCLIEPLERKKNRIKIAVSCEDNVQFEKIFVYRNGRLVQEVTDENCELNLSFAKNTRWHLEVADLVGNKEIRYLSGEELEQELMQKERSGDFKEKSGTKEEQQKYSEDKRNQNTVTDLMKENDAERTDSEKKDSGKAGETMRWTRIGLFLCMSVFVLWVWIMAGRTEKRFKNK